jgi:hypothetical protein
MVAGSNPARGANDLNNLAEIESLGKIGCVCIVSANQLPPEPALLRLRHALAFPLHVVALILSYSGDTFALLAAKIAGDD